VKVVLGEQFAKFRATSASGGTVDCKSMVLQFFLRTLSRGAYNVEFTDDGSENEGNINGLEYLRCVEVYTREISKQFMIPLIRYSIPLVLLPTATTASLLTLHTLTPTHPYPPTHTPTHPNPYPPTPIPIPIP
jgi:hypothetical protein